MFDGISTPTADGRAAALGEAGSAGANLSGANVIAVD
jgi:hypothetical protein